MADPYRWRVDTQFLSGVRMGRWWRLLREVGFDVDARYAHRAALLTALSAYNSATAALDARVHGPPAPPAPAPLFVLGHWRSGTTLLYQLLCTDPQRTFPDAYQTVNPSGFRLTGRVGKRLFAGLVPETRPQDQMPLGFDLPEEDEYAIALLGGGSPYLGKCFPRQADRFARYLTLRDASDAERRRFIDALVRFLGLLASVDPRPVVLKSPAHTGRLRLLLEAFPDARFVHVHRDPYRVYQSTLHLWDTTGRLWCLQAPDPARREADVLDTYAELHEAYFEDRRLVPPGQLVEVAYHDLVADPLTTLEHVYDRLGLGSFEPTRAPAERALAAAGGYRTNAYAPLPAADRARVRAAWAASFDAWGYDAAADRAAEGAATHAAEGAA